MTDKKTYWIVWNEDKSEGFITDIESDADTAQTGISNPTHSSIGYTTAGIL